MVLLGQHQRFLAVGGQSFNLKIWLGGKQRGQRFAQNSMIVGNNNPDFGHSRTFVSHNLFLDAFQSADNRLLC